MAGGAAGVKGLTGETGCAGWLTRTGAGTAPGLLLALSAHTTVHESAYYSKDCKLVLLGSAIVVFLLHDMHLRGKTFSYLLALALPQVSNHLV